MLLYADEDVDRAVILLLRDKHDIVVPREARTTGRTDAWHLSEAARAQRLVVTANHTDFRFLHRVLTTNSFFSHTESHAGILSVTRTPGALAWARSIDAFVRRTGDLAGRLFVWHPNEDEWIQDPWRPDE